MARRKNTQLDQSFIDKRNSIYVEGDVGHLVIWRRDGSEHHIIFDAADLPKVKKYNLWRIQPTGSGKYAANGPYANPVFLHRYLNDTPYKQFCCMRDGDHYNLKRSNLYNTERYARLKRSRRQAAKSSAVQGVTYDSQGDRWQARYWDRQTKKMVRLGSGFKTEAAAAKAKRTWEQQQKGSRAQPTEGKG